MSDEPEVILAQYREITRQVPLLYSLLIVNTAAVAFTHRQVAPPFLTYVMPGGLCMVSLVRMLQWRFPRKAAPDLAAARAQLKRSITFAGGFGLIAVLWALSLGHYGGPYEQGHVAIYISITVIACIFCLMSLPQAALLGCLLVTGPYLAYYFAQRSAVWSAIAINIALVSLVMIRIILNSFKAFVELVRSQRDMAAKTAEAERLGEENARLAMTDSLTGLPNRRYFFTRLEAAIEAAKNSDARFAIGVLDLDRFKPINDTYGHVLGDRLLAEVGRRLSVLASSDLVVARLGGDEFGIILFSECDTAAAVGESLCRIICHPYKVDELGITIGCSGGFAIFPDAGHSAHALFDRSDYALYHVKSEERGRCALFSVEHETRIRSERAIEAALQAADFDAELSIHLQPIIDLTSMRTTTAEILARWSSPTLGNVLPHIFIPAAERLGLIHRVTRALFAQALDALSELPETLQLSFNLSAHDIVSPDTIAFLLHEIRRRGVSPARLTFELTETALMRDFDLAIVGMRELRDIGCGIVLDDFGTGYSSLSYLRRLPVDKVKVDRSFVMTTEGADKEMLAAIKGLCDQLNLRCVVEGIESPTQLELVRSLGYREAQGYLLGRPVALASFLAEMGYDRHARSSRSAGWS
ncbi:MAG TPA: EAL domain-containing protein [Sphingomonas sp.]|nr:EAL domain-containing protein [Sphingomonas sp.]